MSARAVAKKKRLQVDLDRNLLVKLELLRRAFSHTSQTETVRAAISVALRLFEGQFGTSTPLNSEFRAYTDRRKEELIDPLDLDSDFDGSMSLARLNRWRFYRKPDQNSHRRWGEVLRELVESEPADHEQLELLDAELGRYRAASMLQWEWLSEQEMPGGEYLSAAADLAWNSLSLSVRAEIEEEIESLRPLTSGPPASAAPTAAKVALSH